jgi:hypothetical protein
MGLYNIYCQVCRKEFMWFSGNTFNQMCDICQKDVNKTKEVLTQMVKEQEIKEDTKKPREVEVYLCGIDYQHEIGEASDGNTVYPGVNSLKENHICWEGCGIVKCKIVFDSWVVEQEWKKMYSKSSKAYTKEDFENNRDIIRFESAQKRLKWLEKQVIVQKKKVKEYKKLADKSVKTKGKKNVIK